MDRLTKDRIHILLEWGIGVACVVALLVGIGSLAKITVLSFILFGGAAFSIATFEQGWYRSSQLGWKISKSVSLLMLIWGFMILVGYRTWPHR
jgi:hypothetical protein